MPSHQEKYLTQYLEDFGINPEDIKASDLPKLTKSVHERNELIAELEKSDKDFRKEQIEEEIEELNERINSLLEKITK